MGGYGDVQCCLKSIFIPLWNVYVPTCESASEITPSTSHHWNQESGQESFLPVDVTHGSGHHQGAGRGRMCHSAEISCGGAFVVKTKNKADSEFPDSRSWCCSSALLSLSQRTEGVHFLAWSRSVRLSVLPPSRWWFSTRLAEALLLSAGWWDAASARSEWLCLFLLKKL